MGRGPGWALPGAAALVLSTCWYRQGAQDTAVNDANSEEGCPCRADPWLGLGWNSTDGVIYKELGHTQLWRLRVQGHSFTPAWDPLAGWDSAGFQGSAGTRGNTVTVPAHTPPSCYRGTNASPGTQPQGPWGYQVTGDKVLI